MSGHYKFAGIIGPYGRASAGIVLLTTAILWTMLARKRSPETAKRVCGRMNLCRRENGGGNEGGRKVK